MGDRPSLGELSSIGLGCWQFGTPGGRQLSAEEVASLISMARERGINHFDTAQDYGKGRSEEVVGRALGSRDDVFVATKSDLVDADETARRIDESRQRLRRDVIDLFYVHWPRQGVDLRPMMAALENARAAGRIRHIGVSNFSVEDLERAGEVSRVDAHQLCYNLLWRFPEREIVPYCRSHGIALVSYSSLAQGLLAGHLKREPVFAADDMRKNNVYYDSGVWEHVFEGVAELERIAGDVPLAQLALRWIANTGNIRSVLVGVRNEGQLAGNADALALDVDESTFEKMTRISDEIHEHIPDVGNIFKYYP